MQRVAVLGHGRFGAALCGLIEAAGLTAKAFDERADVAPHRRAASVADLVDGADIVVISVPVAGIDDALVHLSAHLSPGQLVLDVGSVKVAPEAALRARLGERVAFLPTHPLFGPISLARGERPLRVVLCPVPEHPDAIGRARAFYEKLGCVTLEMTAHEHDRLMAETHVLAFFVAKGMLDAGVDPAAPAAPPSFQAMARTIEAVRGDAGHLFAAIQAENPYAAAARRRLLDALASLDQAIARAGEGAEGRLAIAPPAALPEPSAAERIAEIDREIAALLAQRASLAKG